MIPVILEVAISLIVIFFLLSTVVSFINEIIALVLSSRGKTLKNSLKTLFDEMGQEGEASIIDKIYESAHINKLRIFKWLSTKKYLPSYISPENFVSGLLAQINKLGKEDDLNIEKVKANVKKLENVFLKEKLLTLAAELEDGKKDIAGFKQKIEAWFETSMVTVTKVYRLRSKVIIAFISIILAGSLNIDSVKLTEFFWKNKEQREMMVSFAENIAENDFLVDTSGLSTEEKLKAYTQSSKMILDSLHNFELPIYHKGEFREELSSETNPLKKLAIIFTKIFGILLTTFCLTLGGPYWYQLMQSLLKIRKSLKRES